MSKSRGNIVDPWEVIDRHGADAFRWYYLAAQQPWAGYRFSADAVGEAMRQLLLHAVEHVRVLGAVREHRGAGDGSGSAAGRPSGPAIWTAGRSRGCRALIAT